MSDSGNFRSLPYSLLSVPYFVLCLYKDSVFWYKEKKGFLYTLSIRPDQVCKITFFWFCSLQINILGSACTVFFFNCVYLP